MNKFTLTAAAAAVAFAAAMPAQAATLLGVKVGADAWFTGGKTEIASHRLIRDSQRQCVSRCVIASVNETIPVFSL